MKVKFFIIFIILFILLIFSCPQYNFDIKYKPSYARYNLHGYVKNGVTNTTLPNIKLSLINTHQLLLDDLTTDTNGLYSFDYFDPCWYYEKLYIRAEDIDGVAFGLFVLKDEPLEFEEDDFKGGEDYYLGMVDLTVDILLTPGS